MDWQRLCQQLNLGALTDKPMELTGGLMHTMYKIVTEDGVYAVKCLNPQVMARTEAHANFAAAERLENMLEHTDLPILPALTIGGRKMQEVDGAFFYIFIAVLVVLCIYCPCFCCRCIIEAIASIVELFAY